MRSGRAVVVAFVAALASMVLTAAAAASAPPRIAVLSNRADLVSGGDALVQIVPPAGVDPSGVRAALDGRDITGDFAVRPDGRFEGLVTGLADGPNRLIARVRGGRGAELTITNHPISGPIFAGPQVQPWVCANEANGLGAPTDAACDTAPVFSFFYKDAVSGQFLAYDPSSPPPSALIATTTTDTGKTVPYVIRQERGVIDRGIYQIAVLFDPKQPWAPWAPQAGWDHKLLVPQGAGCDSGHVMQAPQSVQNDQALSRGYAVAMTEMDDNTQDCNDVVQAEAFMMLKEHIIEAYGPIRFTVGVGGSGGSMSQTSMAANYPGLLNGLQPGVSFPDIWTTYREMADCKLLAQYFDSTSPELWTEPQRAAASGNATLGVCEEQQKARSDSYVSATGNATSSTCHGNPWTYDPITNPKGTRCDVFDYGIAIWGRRPQDGFANRAYDNVGVQYGLRALEDGEILPEQFVDLNEKIGGLDIDGNYQAQRTVADPPAIAIAYRSGRLTNGRWLADVPIIDQRGTDPVEEHFDFHTDEMRARLDRDNGTHANQLAWDSPCPLLGCPPMATQSFDVIDRWLTAVEKDRSNKPLRVKVIEDKPVDAVDSCWLPNKQVTDPATCRALIHYTTDPRSVAGGPTTGDVVKCQLQPLDRADYSHFGVTFSDDQWARLQKAFPSGVCDYRLPGVDQQPPIGSWLTYADGPGGRPLGPAPRSHALPRHRRHHRRGTARR